jgi:hypothetical protein
VGASAVAGAASDSGATAQPPRQHPGETLLTGDTAAKVTAAAKEKVPGGTIIRVETDAEGSPYEAHVRKSDGSEVTVKVDEDFNVTKVEDFGGPGGPPPSGGGPGDASFGAPPAPSAPA